MQLCTASLRVIGSGVFVMLTITTQQSVAFDREEGYRQAGRLAPRLQQSLPQRWAATSDPEEVLLGLERLRRGVDEASEYGFIEDDEVQRFVELWSLVEGLGSSERHHDAIAMLDNPSIAEGWPATRALLVAICHGGMAHEENAT